MTLFGLKNVGIIYQWLVNNVFKDQIDRNMKIYIDDMLIKSHVSENHIHDPEETFTNLHKYQMKLNLIKCVFWVISGKFLKFMVSHQGIEGNLEKIQIVR